MFYHRNTNQQQWEVVVNKSEYTVKEQWYSWSTSDHQAKIVWIETHQVHEHYQQANVMKNDHEYDKNGLIRKIGPFRGEIVDKIHR